MSAGEPTPRPRAVTVLLLAGVLSLVWYCVQNTRVTGAITHFLPSGEGRLLAEVSSRMADSEWTRTIMVSVSGGTVDQLRVASHGMTARLEKNPLFTRVQNSVPESVGREVYAIYFPRRAYLWSDNPQRDAATTMGVEGMQDAARVLVSELRKPMGTLARQVAVEDPLLVFPRRLQSLETFRNPALVSRQGVFMTADERTAVVFSTTTASAFHTESQSAALDAIDQAFGAQRSSVPSLTLAVSSVGRFAIRAEREIRGDTTMISAISTVAVVFLFLVVFGSVRSIFLGVLPIVTGVLAATAVCTAWFGELHGITLAFGATAIGVCEDYPVHLLNHHALSPMGQTAFQSLRRIRAGLIVGALTTAAGIAGLGWTALPGIREVATFSATGTIVALLTTLWIVPHYLPLSGNPSRVQRWGGVQLARLVGALIKRRAVGFAILLVTGLCIVFGGSRVRFVGGIEQLAPTPADMARDDRDMRKLVGAFDQGRFVIAVGPDLETALQRNDEAANALSDAQQAGELTAFQSLHAALPSRQLQQRNVEAIQAHPAARANLLSAFEQAGFERSFFEATHFFDRPTVPPLDLKTLRASPLSSLVSGFVLDLGTKHAIITLLRDVRQPDALASRLKGVSGVHLFDQRTFIDTLYQVYRDRTVQLLIGGLALVFLLVFVRYRALRPTLGSVVPAIVAASAALSILALAGEQLTLMHVVGTLLVLSLGVDYGVFLVEASGHPEDLGAAALSVVVGCLTTALSFGLLAWSTVPALRGLGQVVGLGTFLALLLAPTGLLWLRSDHRGGV